VISSLFPEPTLEWGLVATHPLLGLGPDSVEITAADGVMARMSHVFLHQVLYMVY